MIKLIFLILSLSITFTAPAGAAGEVLTKIAHKDYLRLMVRAQRDLLKIVKSGDTLVLKSLDTGLLENLHKELEKEFTEKRYVKSLAFIPVNDSNNVPYISITLKDKNIEMFSFYKDSDQSFSIDLWDETESVDYKKSVEVLETEKDVSKIDSEKQKSLKASDKKIKDVQRTKNTEKNIKSVSASSIVEATKSKDYLDFRYGASFIWDYAPLVPDINYSLSGYEEHKGEKIDISRKTPEYFYPIKDRDYSKSDQEAHLQLSINLFRKKKWGLMYKSITLYHQKYGEDVDVDINEYIKANALLKENLLKGEMEPPKNAISLLENIAARSKDYDMRKAISKYLMENALKKQSYIESLAIAKRFYVDAKENFDYEEISLAAQTILFSLGQLKQYDHMQGIIEDKIIAKSLPKQILWAYQIYTLLKLEKNTEAINIFESGKKSMPSIMHESIMYNVGEAYFREARYEKAIKIFDEFIKKYSFHTKASFARLRIALAFDILEKDEKVISTIYRNAIDRSQDDEISFEARIRYTALRSVRKINISEEDLEIRSFLDKKENQKISDNNQKLLWLVRLRTFIKDEKYVEAMSFLTALPLKTMVQSERRVFQADGAEIVHGIIKYNYINKNYGQVVRAWDIYRDVYIDKVAKDPQLQYIVADSYIHMGLWKGFNDHYAKISNEKNPYKKTFPVWIKRDEYLQGNDLLEELQLRKNMKLGNFESARKNIENLKEQIKDFPRLSMYQGILNFKDAKYQEAIVSLENFLVHGGSRNLIDEKELGEIVSMYIDSIYESGNLEKFLKVSGALLEDTKINTNKFDLNEARSKTHYLRTEVLFLKNLYGDVLNEIEKFEGLSVISPYQERMEFLKGQGLIKVGRKKDGVDLYQKLLLNPEVGDHVKELIKTELTLLSIKDRVL